MLTGFDQALAVVLRRRALGERCPWTGEVFAPLPTDGADGVALRAKALTAPAGERRDRVLALLADAGWAGVVVQLRLWDEPRRAA
jgi:hypothetical protein